MAADNVIDELQLKINANANTAIKNLDRLQIALTKTAKSISSFSSATKSISTFGKKIDTSGLKTLETRLSTLGKLGNVAMSGLSNVFSKTGSVIGSVVSGIVGNFNIFNRSARSTSLVATTLKTALGTIIGLKGITGVFNWVKEAVALGGDITEIDHIVESVFSKNMVGYVQNWANTAIEQFGIAEAQAKRYAGVMTSMFQASNVGVSDSGKMAMDLVGLAGDLAAFYNIDTETAYNKIRAGMAGMVRPLRDLGIDLTAATLDEYRLAQGIQTSYREMSQAEKVMLRYRYLMDATKTQQGDFARTNLSLANSMRTLKAYAQAVTTQIGVGLASAIRHVVIWLNQLMKYLLKAAQAFATFMQTIFGKYKGGASGVAMEGLGDSADFAEDLADGAGAAADNLGSAADAAKELKKDLSVLPFDELNQLNKDREATGSGGSGGGSGAGGAGIGGIGDDFLDASELWDASELGKLPDWISKWAEEIKARFKGRNWEGLGESIASGLNKGLKKVYDVLDPSKVREKIFPWIDAFTETFNSFIKNFDFDLLGRTVGRAVNDIAMIYDRIITGIDFKQLGSRLADGLNGLVSEIDWHGLGKTIGDHFMIAWNTLYGFVHNLDWKDLGKALGEGLNGLNDAINWSTIADAITTGFNGVFTALSNFTKTVKWGEIAQNITDGLNTAIHNFRWADNGKALGDFIRNLCDTLIKVIDDTDWEGFGRGIAMALQQIPWGKMLEVVGKVIVDVLGGILRGMAETPAGLFAESLMVGMMAFKYKEPIMAVVNVIVSHLTGAESLGALVKAGGGLGQALTTGFAGPAALATAGVAAFIMSLRGIAQAADSLRGGNGVITQVGAAFDDLIGKMAESREISNEEADALFLLKEEQENLGASTEETAKVIIDKWIEMGGTASTAKRYVDELAQSGRLSSEEFETMSKVFGDTVDIITVKAGELDLRGVEVSAAFDDMRNAIMQLQTASGDMRWSQVLYDFDQTQGSAATAQEALDMLRGTVETYGFSMEDIISILGEKYPIAEQTYSTSVEDAGTATIGFADTLDEQYARMRTTIGGLPETAEDAKNRIVASQMEIAQATAETAESQATSLEDWQNNVQTYRDGVLRNLQDVGAGWGSLNAEQNESLQSLNSNLEESINQQQVALENMRVLNNSGLDEATVQAILNQVEPSSAAMTDLIGHMQADDATWQQFHSNIQENLKLTDDLGAIADGFAEEYARAYAPEFVTIGEDFKVEGGKIGKFSVEGVAAGVYDNTDQAVTAMKNLALDMQKQYQTTDEQHSPSKVYERFAKNDVDGFIWGIQTNTPAAIKAMQQFAKAIQDGMNDLPERMRSVAETGSSSFAAALEHGLSAVDGVINTIRSTITNGLNIDLYSEGYNAGQSFANGFSSVYIPTPHMYVSSYDYHDMGDGGYMYTPNFGIQWYKAGGLFKGGKGVLAGLAEGGRDEAVLPLENRAAMARIGNAIAEAGGNGYNMAEKIASKLAEVIIMTQTDKQDPVFHIEVKTEDNETLARAVTRGMEKLGYANNVPGMSWGY